MESKDEQAAKESETVKFLMEKESVEKMVEGMLQECDGGKGLRAKLRQISQMSIAHEQLPHRTLDLERDVQSKMGELKGYKLSLAQIFIL